MERLVLARLFTDVVVENALTATGVATRTSCNAVENFILILFGIFLSSEFRFR